MANIFLDTFNAHTSQHNLTGPKGFAEQRALMAIGKETGKLRGKELQGGIKANLHTDAENAEYNRRMEQYKANRRNVKVSLAETPWG